MDPATAARGGNEAAFIQLFDDHHAPLFRFAYRMTGSAADAEDIVQECFLELLRPGCSYDPGRTSVRTYLFGVVRNQSLKRIQRNARAQEIDVEPVAAHSPESLALHAELKELDKIMKTDVPAFNQLVRDQNIPAVVVKTASENP